MDAQDSICEEKKSSQLLRYKEQLFLNRKGYSQTFKSVTREKRNNILDGSGTVKDPSPSLGHYRPRYTLVESRL